MKTAAPQRRRRLRTMALAGLLTAATLSSMAPAFAEGNPVIDNDQDQYNSPERCADHSEDFRFRFYYHTGYQGSWLNIGHIIYDLGAVYSGDGHPHPLTFCYDKGNGDGAGQKVMNNAASAYNWYDYYSATVYYSAGYKGAADYFSPKYGSDLGSTRNDNRSIKFERVSWAPR